MRVWYLNITDQLDLRHIQLAHKCNLQIVVGLLVLDEKMPLYPNSLVLFSLPVSSNQRRSYLLHTQHLHESIAQILIVQLNQYKKMALFLSILLLVLKHFFDLL